jgi:hypothetical protein
MIPSYASPQLRDQFLAALDADNQPLCIHLARDLAGCGNPLPGMTCDQLGLPMGSTYGTAAQTVLLRSTVNGVPEGSKLTSVAADSPKAAQ